MISYKITPDEVKSFSAPGKNFLSFNEFVNIARWYRDAYFGPDHVPEFEEDIGRAYNVWTRRSVSTYLRHIFPDELTDAITISFEIPCLERNASFPIRIKIYDDHGTYFEHEQEVVMERLVEDRFILTGWRRVPKIREFLLSQQNLDIPATS